MKLILRPERERIGPEACPILFRWTFFDGGDRGVKLMLHHFPPNADDRDVHDHPRPFMTMVLAGGYDDLVPCKRCEGTGRWVYPHRPPSVLSTEGGCWDCEGDGLVVGDRMRRGMVRRRLARHTHRTKVGPRGCWTLVAMGPTRKPWGFFREGRWWPWREYAAAFGDGMRCESDDELIPKTNRVLGEALLDAMGDRAPASLRAMLGLPPVGTEAEPATIVKHAPMGLSGMAYRSGMEDR